MKQSWSRANMNQFTLYVVHNWPWYFDELVTFVSLLLILSLCMWAPTFYWRNRVCRKEKQNIVRDEIISFYLLYLFSSTHFALSWQFIHGNLEQWCNTFLQTRGSVASTPTKLSSKKVKEVNERLKNLKNERYRWNKNINVKSINY